MSKSYKHQQILRAVEPIAYKTRKHNLISKLYWNSQLIRCLFWKLTKIEISFKSADLSTNRDNLLSFGKTNRNNPDGLIIRLAYYFASTYDQ